MTVGAQTRAVVPAHRAGAQVPGRGPGVTAILNPAPQVVMQAAEWRFLVRAVYVGAGSPAVPGFTASQVDQILWGELPANAEFLAAMLRVLSSASASTVRGSAETAGEAMDAFRNALALLEPKRSARPTAPEATTTGVSMEIHPSYWFGDLAGRGQARGFTPPNPDALSSAAEFLDALVKLRRWADISLRQLEERSKAAADDGEAAIWLCRATVSDVVRRGKLPKPEFVKAYVAACELPLVEQERWLAALHRLVSPPVIGVDTAGRMVMVHGVRPAPEVARTTVRPFRERRVGRMEGGGSKKGV